MDEQFSLLFKSLLFECANSLVSCSGVFFLKVRTVYLSSINCFRIKCFRKNFCI